MTDQEKSKREWELKREVESWVDRTFNYIELEVYDKMADNMLFEYIRPEPIDDYFDEFLHHNFDEDEIKELRIESKDAGYYDLLSFFKAEREDEVMEWRQESSPDANYPMWSTLFEFRDRTIPENWYEAIEKAGFGIIEGLEPFNTTLFVAGAGYSFYASHWIPLYLNIFEDKAIKYVGVNYNHL